MLLAGSMIKDMILLHI